MMEPSRVVDDPDAREEPPEPADEPGDEQAETAEDLFEPCDEEDDLTYIIADGPQGVRGRGMPGKYVEKADTVRGFQEILAGKHDDMPEQAFYLVGTIDEAKEKAKELATKG